ncbi:MAG: S41 family peptidase [Pyrinomonadaceae bacterium]
MKKPLRLKCISIAFVLLVTSAAQVYSQRSTLVPDVEPFKIGRGTIFSASTSKTESTPNRRHNRKFLIADDVVADYKEALNVIKNNYVNANENFDDLNKSAINLMLNALDPHSSYFDKREFEELLTEQNSEYFGIGATIANYKEAGVYQTFVISTIPESSSNRAGIRFGDKIIAVNGEKVEGYSSNYVRDKVRGKLNTKVRIKIQRALTGKTETFYLKRTRVAQPSIPDSYMLTPNLGYIALSNGFNYTTSKELTAAMSNLSEQGMTSLVIDLRGNPGGILEQAVRVVEKFISFGKVVTTQKGRLPYDDRAWKSRNREPATLPLILLVNDETASASEVVAGALQDYDRALIVGERTFGKGLVQSIIELPSGGGLTLTTAKYFTPSGRLIQRDYSDGGLYAYYRHEGKQAGVGAQTAEKTTHGRVVYGGDGISPDLEVKSIEFSQTQIDLQDELFLFSRELAAGRIKGLENFAAKRKSETTAKIGTNEFQLNETVLDGFFDWCAKNSVQIKKPTIYENKNFITEQIRYNLASATFGNVKANQILIANDPQVRAAIGSVKDAAKMIR